MAAVIADLRATPGTNTTSAQFAISVPVDATAGAARIASHAPIAGQIKRRRWYFDSQVQLSLRTMAGIA